MADEEALRRADAEAEKALKRARELEERRAAKRASPTPLGEFTHPPPNPLHTPPPTPTLSHSHSHSHSDTHTLSHTHTHTPPTHTHTTHYPPPTTHHRPPTRSWTRRTCPPFTYMQSQGSLPENRAHRARTNDCVRGHVGFGLSAQARTVCLTAQHTERRAGSNSKEARSWLSLPKVLDTLTRDTSEADPRNHDAWTQAAPNCDASLSPDPPRVSSHSHVGLTQGFTPRHSGREEGREGERRRYPALTSSSQRSLVGTRYAQDLPPRNAFLGHRCLLTYGVYCNCFFYREPPDTGTVRLHCRQPVVSVVCADAMHDEHGRSRAEVLGWRARAAH